MTTFLPDAKWTPKQADRVASMLNSREDPRWLWAAHGSTVRGMDRDGHMYVVTADSNVTELDEGGAAHLGFEMWGERYTDIPYVAGCIAATFEVESRKIETPKDCEIRAFWGEEDGQWVATVCGLGWSTTGDTLAEAAAEMEVVMELCCEVLAEDVA